MQIRRFCIIILLCVVILGCRETNIKLNEKQITNCIAYVAYPLQKDHIFSFSSKEIYIIKAEPGAIPIRITDNTYWEEQPVWIDGGKSLLIKRCIGMFGSGKERWYLTKIELLSGKEENIFEIDATATIRASKNVYIDYGKIYYVNLITKTIHELLTESGLNLFQSQPRIIINDFSVAREDSYLVLHVLEKDRVPKTQVFKDERKCYEIAIIRRDGDGFQVLTNDTFPDGIPSISPDGKFIAFNSERDGFDEIFIMEITTRQLRRLTDPPLHGYSPTWSPDGKRVAFISDRDGHSHIYVINADGTGLFQLTKGEFEVWPGISWSPR